MHRNGALAPENGASRECQYRTISSLLSGGIIRAPKGLSITAPMKFVVKFFSEIAIKSKPVRRRLLGQLYENLRSVLKDFDPDIQVKKAWDKLLVETQIEDPATLQLMVEAMSNTSGITYILEVVEYELLARWVESGFDRNAKSAKGALGLMQLMPPTHRALGRVTPFIKYERPK